MEPSAVTFKRLLDEAIEKSHLAHFSELTGQGTQSDRIASALAARERVEALFADVERDAKRYRWLRDVYSAYDHRIFLSPQGQFREKLIDAAIQQEPRHS